MTEPTDAEILALLAEKNPTPSLVFLAKDDAKLADLQAAAVAIARAVLAKWRAPPAVAWKHDCSALLTNDVELWINACPHCGKPRTPTQPTQAQAGAVPLTDEQTESLLWKYGYDPDDEHMAAMLKEARGIKGGQHGADI